MRKLRIYEVLKLDSHVIIPTHAKPAERVTVTWSHGAIVTLTFKGGGYLIEWGDKQNQWVYLLENNHSRRVNFVCSQCGHDYRHLYFNGEKWGCFYCLNLENHRRGEHGAFNVTKVLSEIPEKETNELIKDLAKLLL